MIAMDDHIRTRSVQRARDGGTDALGGTGDEN
jgi:hypothetical protein